MKKVMALLLLTSTCYAHSKSSLIRHTEPKVVKIGIVQKKGRGVCSGAIISKEGMVLTCAHCFEHEAIRKVFIKTSEGVVYKAELLSIDKEKDLALIAPETAGSFPFFKLGPMPTRGQEVISFGSSLGLQHTVTFGYVTNLIKEIYILHDAFINPGNSGGPLVDFNGRLIGINEATIGYGLFQRAIGMDVAISIETIKNFLRENSK